MFVKEVYEVDGEAFVSLDGFYDEISKKLIPQTAWGRNLDAFNDILRGGFGTAEEGFILRWKNSRTSQERLGYPETVRELRLRLCRCHPANRDQVAQELTTAEAHLGKTVFDWLVDIIREHCAGGTEEEDGVELVLC